MTLLALADMLRKEHQEAGDVYCHDCREWLENERSCEHITRKPESMFERWARKQGSHEL